MSLLRTSGSRIAAAALLAATMHTDAFAQEPEEAIGSQGDAIIVTGTRRAERTVADASSPVDVVSAAELATTPAVDLNDKLMSLVPSFNAQIRPGVDGASFVRAATLRALSADQTLVLVNGKRRHRSAYVDITPQRGAQAADLSQIPEIAVRRVEVLRDGASAQYGSDAIGGVINVLLNDELGYAASAQVGQYYEGDGFNHVLAARAGLRFTDKGTLSLSVEQAGSDPTNRSSLPSKGGGVLDSSRYRFFYNLSLELAEGLDFYSFGNYGYSRASVFFSRRSPSSYQRSIRQNGPGAIFPTFSLSAIFPTGFQPRFGSKTDDASVVAGLRGEILDGLSWDLSGRYGRNAIRYTLDDSVNPTFGPNTPTSFRPGRQIQSEAGVNLDLVYLWDAGLARPVNVAFGGEYRREGFQLLAGDPASYEIGPLDDLSPGSLGFPGISPRQAGDWDRWSSAAYLDVDADITERLNLSAAVRHEHFPAVGSTTNYKLAGRYTLAPSLNLRGTLSTGFRAPTPGQQHITTTSQTPDPLNPGVQLTKALIPPTDPVAIAFGGGQLKPEKSRNYSLGFVLTPARGLTLSVDAYRIDIRDRIGLLPSIPLTPAQRAQLVASGIPSAASLNEYRFFINGFKTRTDGIDLVGSYAAPLAGGTFSTTIAYNYNRTKILRADPRFETLDTHQYYEHHLPRYSATVSVNYDIGKIGLFARGRTYSSWVDPVLGGTLASLNQTVSPETFFDAAVTYRPTRGVSITAGAQNIFDNYPDNTIPILQGIGLRYPVYRSYEADGGQYYLRVGFNF